MQCISDAQDELDFCRLVWSELENGGLDLSDPVSAIASVPAALVTDCRSFYDALNKKESSNLGMQRDKRSSIEALAVRQHCEETKTLFCWCNADAQLADGLTKESAFYKVEDFFLAKAQRWRLTYDETVISAKPRKGNELSCLVSGKPKQGSPRRV